MKKVALSLSAIALLFAVSCKDANAESTEETNAETTEEVVPETTQTEEALEVTQDQTEADPQNTTEENAQ